VDVPVTVQPPDGYPSVGGRVDFGGIPGAEARAAVTVTGPGCAWVETFTITASPDGVGPATVVGVGANSAQRCLHVAAGATAELPLRLQLARPRAGVVAGTVAVRLAPDGQPDAAVTSPVPFLADVSAPPTAAPRPWWLIAAGVAAAICAALAWAVRRRRVR
jgi:hypothetical protein